MKHRLIHLWGFLGRQMFVFYFFAAIAIWLGALSLRGGLRFLAYVRRAVALPVSDYAPFVSVIAPFRGMDEGLKENIGALFAQNYPAYEIIFVTDRNDDPAIAVSRGPTNCQVWQDVWYPLISHSACRSRD